MTTRPWMPLYIADYLADTAHLGALESGAYLHLIMHYWQTGKLPDEPKELARIAKVSSHSWKKLSPTLQKFFHDGWRHKRIDDELANASAISEKRSAAAKSRYVDKPAKAGAIAEQKQTQSPSQPQKKETTEATASDAGASRDVRRDLFDAGLKTLASITGKTPDSCRSLVGKWLKSVNDEAIHVLGAIEDAGRNRVADPVAWINRALQPRTQNGQRRRSVHEANDDLLARVRALDQPRPSNLRDREGEHSVRRIPAR